MPDGRTHDRITWLGAALCIPAWSLLAPPDWRGDHVACGVLVFSTLFSGLMLSPDLDLASSIYRRWGPFRFLWLPYQKLIPHRSVLSHSLLLGPLLRIAYFLVMCFFLMRAVTWCLRFVIPIDRNALAYGSLHVLLDVPVRYPHEFYAAVIGLVLGAGLHVGADTVVSGFKHALGLPGRR